MSDPVEMERRTVSLKVDSRGRTTADVAFIDRDDLDAEAFAPGALKDATVSLNRAHELILGGDRPPFGIARISRRGDRHVADIEFLDTPRGREEYQTAKALDAAGVTQAVSIGFRVEATGPVPEHLRAKVRRYITKAQPLELSLVGVGAIPNAQLTSVKRASSPPKATVKAVERFRAWTECRREPHGALAWDVADFSARRLSYGGLEEGPAVKFFDYDGKRAGYYRPGEDCIHISRGLKAERVIVVAAHECSHWWRLWDASEPPARADARWIAERYIRERLNAA